MWLAARNVLAFASEDARLMVNTQNLAKGTSQSAQSNAFISLKENLPTPKQSAQISEDTDFWELTCEHII